MSQKKKSLKKEENQSIGIEAANWVILAKSDVSWGNILKEFFNYFDDFVEPLSEYKKYISIFKAEYELTMVVIK